MIKTLKENGYQAVRIAVYQIGMTIFGLVLYIAATSAGLSNSQTGRIVKLVTSGFSILFYLVLLYTMARDEGQKDQIKISGGRMKRNNLKFFWLSLTANLLNILVGIIAIVTSLIASAMGDAVPEIVGNIGAVAKTYVFIMEAMYLGVLTEAFSMNAFACLIIAFPAIIVCTVGYIVGIDVGYAEFAKKDKEASGNIPSTDKKGIQRDQKE